MSNSVKSNLRPKSSSSLTSNSRNSSIDKNNIDKKQKKDFSKNRLVKSELIKERDYSLDILVNDILKQKIKNILVMVGAGISTASGILDFRTPGTGLYDNLQKFKIPYPEAIFDIEYFQYNPKPFFTLAKELIPNGKYKPNKIHYFLRLLQEKHLLQRLYTQNIDGLERLAGILPENLVEAHGTFNSAKCIECKTQYSPAFIKEAINSDRIPYCVKIGCKKIVKPNIVFFGESLPKRFDLHVKDFSKAELIIVMGTSLEVEPFASILKYSNIKVPRLLLNREAVGPFRNSSRKTDLKILGDLNDCLDQFVKKLGWENELAVVFESELEKLNNNIKIDDVTEKSNCQIRKCIQYDNKNELIVSDSYKNDQIKTNEFHKISILDSKEANIDLHKSEQLSGFYYLKNNINQNEISNRKENEKVVSEEVKQAIIKRNNELLGIGKINNNTTQTIKDKKNYHTKSTFSALLKSNENLLPPNYKNRLSVNSLISPYNKNTVLKDNKLDRLNSTPNNRNIFKVTNKRNPSKHLTENDSDESDSDNSSYYV